MPCARAQTPQSIAVRLGLCLVRDSPAYRSAHSITSGQDGCCTLDYTHTDRPRQWNVDMDNNCERLSVNQINTMIVINCKRRHACYESYDWVLYSCHDCYISQLNNWFRVITAIEVNNKFLNYNKTMIKSHLIIIW